MARKKKTAVEAEPVEQPKAPKEPEKPTCGRCGHELTRGDAAYGRTIVENVAGQNEDGTPKTRDVRICKRCKGRTDRRTLAGYDHPIALAGGWRLWGTVHKRSTDGVYERAPETRGPEKTLAMTRLPRMKPCRERDERMPIKHHRRGFGLQTAATPSQRRRAA